MTQYYFDKMDSPLGHLTLICSDKGMAAVLWEKEIPGRIRDFHAVLNKGHPILARAQEELQEYFVGARKVFSVPIDVVGTPFQKRACEELGDPFRRNPYLRPASPETRQYEVLKGGGQRQSS